MFNRIFLYIYFNHNESNSHFISIWGIRTSFNFDPLYLNQINGFYFNNEFNHSLNIVTDVSNQLYYYSLTKYVFSSNNSILLAWFIFCRNVCIFLMNNE